MHKLIITAALLGAMFSAQAQSIKIFNSCREKSRIINFQREAANGDVFERYTLGSVCPAKQMPVNRLDIGHYQFDELPIRKNEEFLFIVQSGGTTTYRIVLNQANNSFFVSLNTNEVLTIIISEKLECNCSK